MTTPIVTYPINRNHKENVTKPILKKFYQVAARTFCEMFNEVPHYHEIAGDGRKPPDDIYGVIIDHVIVKRPQGKGINHPRLVYLDTGYRDVLPELGFDLTKHLSVLSRPRP
jgi:hypothetical protein